MSSDAKRASNARYLAKFKTVSVRFTQTDAVAVQSAADSAGLDGHVCRDHGRFRRGKSERLHCGRSGPAHGAGRQQRPKKPRGGLATRGREYAGVRQWTRHRGAQQPLDEWRQKRQ